MRLLLVIFLVSCTVQQKSTDQTRPDLKSCITEKLSKIALAENSVLDTNTYKNHFYLVLWAGPPFPGEQERIKRIKDSVESLGMHFFTKYEGHGNTDGPANNIDQIYLRRYYRKLDSILEIEDVIFECRELLSQFLQDSTDYRLPLNSLEAKDSSDSKVHDFIYTELNKQDKQAKEYILSLGNLHSYFQKH